MPDHTTPALDKQRPGGRGAKRRTAGSAKQDGSGPRQGRRRRDREVLDAAVDIFYEKGYGETTIEDVANAIGILKGSLYHYIDSKEDLLLRIFKEVHEQVEEIQREVAARDDLTPLAKLELYVRTQAEFNGRNLKKIAVYYRDTRQLSAEKLKEIEPLRREHYDFIGNLLEEAQKAGEIPSDADPRVLRHCAIATLIWIYTWYKPKGRLSPTELGRVCSEFVLRGVQGAGTG